MNLEESDKLRQLREIINDAYERYFKEGDGHHKSSEGQITIIYNFGNVFDDDYLNKEPTHTLEIYSYVFSDEGRRKEWSGKILAESLDEAIKFFSQFAKESKGESK